MTTVVWGALTDVGKARQINEDSYFAGVRLFIVADGLGGHRAGEVASALAVDIVSALDDQPDPISADELEATVLAANSSVNERASQDPTLAGMATTVTAISINGDQAVLAHVGDSRCYVLRDGAMRMLSSDHTLVARMVAEGAITAEQAESHPQRSVLTRALGSEPSVSVDCEEIPLRNSDRIMLCSDGLSSYVPQDQITAMLGEHADPQAACAALVAAANNAGGPDNITVVILDISDVAPAIDTKRAAAADVYDPEAPLQDARRAPASRSAPNAKAVRARGRMPARAIAWIAIVALIAGGGLFGLKAWAKRSWFVGVDGNTVTIFQGLPTDFIVSLSSVKEPTSLTLDQVALYYHPRLKEGIRADTLNAARQIAQRVPRTSEASPPPGIPSPSPSGSRT